jgi:molecular chaperone GrpE
MFKNHTPGTHSGESCPAAQAAENNEQSPTEGQIAPDSVPEQEDAADLTPAELTPEEKNAELEIALADTRDQLLRKAADFENFRKRMNQEKQNLIEFANQSLLLDIIPIIDDFERAIQSGESSKDFTALLDGIKMIEKRLTSQLESKWGLKRFNSAGEPFDPNKHEALMMEKSPEVEEAVVQEDLIKGYLLKERVIRAAKVKVLMPEEGKNNEE